MKKLDDPRACPGCQEVIFDDHVQTNGRCGWCGYDPKTGEQACFEVNSDDIDFEDDFFRK